MRRLGAKPAESLHSVCPAGRHLQPYAHTGSARSGQLDFLPLASQNATILEENGDKPLRGRDLQRIEAILLLSREPLTSRKLAQLAQLEDGTQARTLIRKLNQSLDDVGRAFRVEEVAGGYQLLTRHKFASWLRRLGHIPSEIRLSTPALETLAVVAYRQPVTKADIEAIRGVNCGEILRQLMERDLVRIGGRSEELGRPYLYTTTKRFLQQFGLRSLEDLPRAEILRTAAVPPVGKAAESGHHTSNSNHPNQATEIPRSIVDKESDVSVTLSPELSYEEKLARRFGSALTAGQVVPDVRLDDDDDDFEDDELEDDEEDDEFEDELDEDEDDEDLDEDEDFEDDEEWEEVEDEDEDDDDFDDEEDEDWDDEEDEDLDDEEEDLDDEE